MRISNYLEKLRNLSENKKKIVLWTIVGALAIIMGYFWVMSAINSFDKISKNISQIKIPEMQNK